MSTITGLITLGVAVVLLVATPAIGRADAMRDAYQAAGPHEVEVVVQDWKDAKRNRDVPVRVYLPKRTTPSPVILFSHGLGGSRDGYAYLGRHWASHGYVSVHLQHKGSDAELHKQPSEAMANLRKAAVDPQNSINRPQDVRFAVSELSKLNREDPVLKGRLDLEKIGMAGHSFGGWTTLAAIGQRYFPLGREKALAEPSIKAAVSMSAPVPKKAEDYARSFSAIAVPCLHMTGTLDDSPIGDTRAGDRRAAYDHISKADQFLLILKDADHMVFSGRGGLRFNVPGFGGDPSRDPEFQKWVKLSTTAFWDAYLKQSQPAKTWLTQGGLKGVLGDLGTFEAKLTQATDK
jgi:predicted dienelactone hydrolase